MHKWSQADYDLTHGLLHNVHIDVKAMYLRQITFSEIHTVN